MFQFLGIGEARLMMTTVRGPYDINPDKDADGLSAAPIYRYTDTTALSMQISLGLAVQFTPIQKPGWSAGLRASGTIGYNLTLRAADGLESLVLSATPTAFVQFPVGELDLGLHAGYRIVRVSYPYRVPVVGLEVGDGKHLFQVQASPLRYHYWGYKSNGELFKSVSIGDVGIVYAIILGQ